RVLVPTGLPLQQLVERANRIFCESTLPTQYATLIVGKASEGGDVEICNGGHLSPLHVNGTRGVVSIESSTVPVGLFHDQQFASTHMQFSPGDSLVLFTDGFTEACGPDGAEYSVHRLRQLLAQRRSQGARQLVRECMDDLKRICGDSQKLDDRTLMVLEFAPVQH
ncbi:MAG TPA: PP2C family protein-serine/threonine phosphatase, partial [Terriglobales bacterium]|nr:PP2C family protein-serine/threonine phosphatase [Terriglobales bacterium]